MIYPPLNNPEHSQKALDAILSSRILIFNPYRVSDSELLEIVENASWGGEYDLTQAVVMTFTRLRQVGSEGDFDGIYFRLGKNANEAFLPASWIYYGVTSNDTCRKTRHICGKRILRNEKDIRWLVGKRVFISHFIKGYNISRGTRVAYRMHRLYGNKEQDAKTIREAMCAAKIEMLERVIAYPYSMDYLYCSRNFFEYEPRIRRAIDIISHYSDITPPPDPAN